MKKLMSVLLVSLLVLAGCSKKADPKPEEKPSETSQSVKIGTGVLASSKVKEGKDGKDSEFESNVLYATVIFDGDVIKKVVIDAAQNAQSFKEDGTVNPFEERKTKKELGPDYKMKEFGKAIAEWDEQTKEFENYAAGKKVADLTSLKLTDDGKATDADLSSKVTIHVNDFVEVIKRASENAVEVNGATKIATVSSTSAGEKGLELNTMVTSVAYDKDNKVVYSFTDEAKMTAEIKDGKATPAESTKTKRQAGMEYGMAWDKQVAEFDSWTIGKTVDQIVKAADDSDLTSKVTVKGSMHGFTAIHQKASENAVAI